MEISNESALVTLKDEEITSISAPSDLKLGQIHSWVSCNETLPVKLSKKAVQAVVL